METHFKSRTTRCEPIKSVRFAEAKTWGFQNAVEIDTSPRHHLSMPYTYNGIGTHYYGHKNVEKRSAACHSCGRTANLESYDTRLWFTIFFIPIVPLGRKRIIDQCPFCKRHYAVDADKWETSKQLNVSGALERYQADQTPEAAMEAHQQLLNFHQTGEAAELRREMAEKIRQNAKAQAYLGRALPA